MQHINGLLRIADEVRAALDDGRPVVALESTLVAHGLPWPENLEVGRAAEAMARQAGAVPATVAVVDGRIAVGVDGATLERIATPGTGFVKVGRADLAPLVAAGGCGATTVSATAFASARAGIRVFATGGIGGVHRGDDADVSSDLTTLARERIAVVSAGAKAILDLPRTLEVLETLGVLVLGYRTDELPAFYTRSSGLRLEHRVDDAEAAARVLRARFALDEGGVLVANPIPAEHALDEALVAQAIAAALEGAARTGVRGKALTPWLLSSVARETGARSLAANRALVLDNVRVGAEIAAALARLERPAPAG
jgi:pseudouridine-5'-phosphate glycosidase